MAKIPKLPYGEGSMSVRKDGLIMYRKNIKLNDNETVSKCVYAKTSKECMMKMREEEEKLKNKNKITQEKEILCDAMRNWLEIVKRPTLKSQSYTRLLSTIKNQIEKSNIGHMRYQLITTEELQELINSLNEKRYSKSVIKKTFDSLNDFYRYSSARYDFKNPMLLVVMPVIDNIKAEEREIEWFDEEDIEKFIDECGAKYKTGSQKYQGGYAIGANIYLGMRIGELLALQWKDIDFDKNTIRIDKTLIQENNPNYNENDPNTKKVQFTIQNSTKKRNVRYVPINSKAKKLLLLHKQVSIYINNDDFVISTKNRRTTTIKNVGDTIKKIEANAETKVQSSGTHILRHTCASLYFRKGIPIETICQILGNTREVCEKTYVHFIEEQLKEAASKIDIIEI